MKRISIMILIIVTLFTGCKNDNKGTLNTDEYEIKISVDDFSHDCSEEDHVGHVVIDYSEEDFISIMAETQVSKLQYVALGDVITMEFDKEIPKEIKVFDYVLKDDGQLKFSLREIQEIPVKLLDNKVYDTA